MNTEPSKQDSAQRALLDSEIRLQQVLDNSSAVVFAKDSGGRYLFVNREFECVTGRTAAELLGHTDDEVFPPAIAARFRHNDLRVMQEGRSIEFEEQADFGTGPRTFISSKFPLLDSDGVAYAVCGMATDITERKRLEDAFSSAALAVSQSEEETLYRQLARYLSTILGVDGAIIATFVPDDPTQMRMLAFHLDGEVRENFDYPLSGSPCETVVGKGFRIYPSRLRELFPGSADIQAMGMAAYAGHPLVGAGDRPLGLISVLSRRQLTDAALIEATLRVFAVRVITELERASAAAALRASEAQYRAIFNASADAMVLWDSQFRRVDVNPAYEKLYGYARDEVIGRGLDFPEFSLDHTERREDLLQRALDGQPHHAEHDVVCKDGRRIRAEVQAVPFRHDGQPHVLIIARDITGRKHAEDALRASEEQYRAIFNASTDALVLWNSRSERVDVNPAYERMYGYTRNEVLAGWRARDLPEDHRRQQAEMIRRTLEGEGFYGEIETLRRGGERFPIEVRTIPIRHRGEPHVLAMIRDLTERRRVEHERAQLEAQLRQAQKMEAIGQLTGGIAHDFNNLLTSIMGYVALASENDRVRGDRRLEGYLAQALRSCERARDLIQQMLMFSRGHAGSPRAVSLGPVVRGALATLQAGLPDTLELSVETADSAPAVMVDPRQVEQVLLNLCINARDATGGAGHVHIAVRPAHADGLVCSGCRKPVQGERVELVVEDDGHGMSPELIERIFEPFFSTKEAGKGTGMGLAMVHGIVHEHDGHVLVESSPGRGARFRVTFPALNGATQHAQGEPDNGSKVRAARPVLAGSVLVVDDEESVGEFMRELLESWGLRATSTPSPEAALELLQAAPARFDVVITDQSMPRLTGLKLARRIHEMRPDLPVVLYTGHGEGLSGDEVDAARLCAVIRKPVDPTLLSQTLARCLQARSPA